MPYTTCANREVLTNEIHPFEGLRDRWDRQIGVKVWVCREEWVVSEEQRRGYTVEPGVWFNAAVHQIRNGETYGAGHTSFRCKTFEEAQQRAQALVAQRHKQYAKKYTVQGAV